MSDQDQPAPTRPALFRITWPVLLIVYILSPVVIPCLVFMYLASR